ncbi:MAG: type VI secretion system baseplate subunit TssG [Candidatus Electrothrix aestuarii]|uniref:Type VI secretion system baseplate subunit TssG n=1 Tax=Candidatus Electrothrix aestuarii TaxID=3062594 RepID=A0AAU8LV67_9BACT|nr:type VI secretion system baseplate subunit TssG [Candidatus Electrothrix aestuarii]
MASKNRQHPSDITDIRQLLLEQGHRLPFVQVIRLLKLYLSRQQNKKLTNEELFRLIRVRPHLSLDFPGTDIVKVEELDEEHARFQITVTFLGLYGSSSPLPTFYTEDLIDEEREGRNATREFLDILNHQFYNTYFQTWEKYNISHQLCEGEKERDRDKNYLILYSLLGIIQPEVRQLIEHERRFLPYIGLAIQRPRSAEGLRALISDMLGEPNVQVHQCVEYQAVISMDQRCFLGIKNTRLGEDAHLGSLVRDRMGKFLLSLGPVDGTRFQELLPHHAGHQLLLECVLFYCDQSLLWDLQLEIKREDMETCQLGNSSWGHLGWNTWLYSTDTNLKNGQVTLQGRK